MQSGQMRLAAIQAAAEERLLAQDLAEVLGDGEGGDDSSDESEGDFDPLGGNADDLLAMAAAMSDSDDESDSSE